MAQQGYLSTDPRAAVVTTPQGYLSVDPNAADTKVVPPPPVSTPIFPHGMGLHQAMAAMAAKAQKGLDWLAGKVDEYAPVIREGARHMIGSNPTLALGAIAAPPVASGQIRAVAHPIENAPELVATAATFGEGGPLITGAKALAGSLAGSVIKEAPKVASGEKSGAQATLSTIESALVNSVGFAVAQKLLQGVMRATPGSHEATLLDEWKKLKTSLGISPRISASTITGQTGTKTLENLAEFPLVANAIADRGNTEALDAIGGEMRRLTGAPGPIPPVAHTGNRVKSAVAADRTAQLGVADAKRAAEIAAVDTEKNNALAAIDAKLAQARKDFPDELAVPPGWSPNLTPPKPNPRYVAAEKEAADARKVIEKLAAEKTKAVPKLSETEILSPDDYKSIHAVLKSHPESVVDLVGRTDSTVAKKVATVLKGDTAGRDAFTSHWLDTHVFNNGAGNADISGSLKRIEEAYTSGVLDHIIPDKAVVTRLRNLAEIASRVKPPTKSKVMSIRGARLPGELIAAAIGVMNPNFAGHALGSIAGIEGTGAAIVSVLRSPVTTKLFTEGLMNPDQAKGLATMVRALRIASHGNASQKEQK